MDDTTEISGLLTALSECQSKLASKHRELVAAIEQRSGEVARLQGEAGDLSAMCTSLMHDVQEALDRARKRASGH